MKRLTVSFDNGPDPECTPEVLDVLAQRGVKASFFVCGQGNRLHPALRARSDEARRLLERARDEGHWIGNHTLTHTVELGTTNDPTLIEREIGGNQEILGELNERRLFRPYMGGGFLGKRTFSPEAIRYLCDGGYTAVMFNCVPRDWENPEGWPEIAFEQMKDQDWTLLIVHDVARYGGMKQLARFLDRAIAEGVEIVQEFPPDCVPIRKGEIVGSLDGIVCGEVPEAPHPISAAAAAHVESSTMQLYHNPLSTCSQKVRLVLAEKSLDFESREINLITGEQHDPEYVKLNPNHVVPTLVHDDRVFVESSLINRYLDEAFPEPPLRPSDPRGRYETDLWIKRIDEEVHRAAPVVTFAMGPRNVMLQQPEEVREANIAGIPDPAARAVRRSVLEKGIHAPEFAGALGVFVSFIDDMESDLAGRPWLSGEAPGLADATALPYVLRLESLAMDPLVSAPRRPRVGEWFSRWKARGSYETAVARWIPALVADMLRKTSEPLWPEVEPIADAASRAR